ncbi:MAG: nucleoside:proton symporter [Leptospiraceae bacterium]|nr:hypothetical protein [Leptospiraceae bacterium]MCP5497041.1 nucleoside:proton symporter [Leptospiraceae bacterium]
MDLRLNLISLVGVYCLCVVAWLTSENKREIPWNVIKWGLGMQFLLGFLIFVVPVTRDRVADLNNLLNALMDASEAGARFLFGSIIVPDPKVKLTPLVDSVTGDIDLTSLINPQTNLIDMKRISLGFIFAFRALPMVIFFSAVVSLAYRMNIIQPVVKVFAKIFQATMKLSGAESLSGAANIFVGIESAIAVKPFLEKMTRSELAAILTSCFGSIASTVLGLYAGLLKSTFPNITGHLMSASLMTIPACFVISKIIIPETSTPLTMGGIPEEPETNEKKPSYMDALILGAMDGVKMAVGIAAVIIAILGVVALVNSVFFFLANQVNSEFVVIQFVGKFFQVVSIDNIFGVLFFPLTFVTGVSLDLGEVWQASILIGQRVLQTSIPPYLALSKLSQSGMITDRTMIIVSYVLCGFAHIPSIGIFVGGLSGLVPSRSHEISSIAWKSLWAATLATLMTGCIAGIFDFGLPSVLGK